jgi:hypothetical protein
MEHNMMYEGQCETTISGHSDSIECVKWGGSGLLYSCSRDRTIKGTYLRSRYLIYDYVRVFCLSTTLAPLSYPILSYPILCLYTFFNYLSYLYYENGCISLISLSITINETILFYSPLYFFSITIILIFVSLSSYLPSHPLSSPSSFSLLR